MQLQKTTVALGASALLLCGAAAGWMRPAFSNANANGAVSATAAPVPDVSTHDGSVPLGTAPNYRAIVAQNRDAVVGITTEGRTKVNDEEGGPGFGPQQGGGDPFSQFFRGLQQAPNNVPVHGLGSGFIVTSDGVILTNAHVVKDAQQVTVKLADRREFRAKVLGLDPATDVAVVKIDAHNLPTVRLANSDQLAVGDYVLAIGAPYGLDESATAGIVSAKGRSLPGDAMVPFIQTDAAVNPGNSGGPLFDAHGAVIGINSQIYSSTGGYQGVSFAIPIDVAIRAEQQIVKNGKVEHARLGVTIQPVDQSLAGSFKLDAPAGALVSKIEPDSAAARAGIEPGDVILKYDGKALLDAGDLSTKVGMAQPGDVATLDIWRQGKALTVKATLGGMPSDGSMLASATEPGHNKLGLSVRPLTSEERSEAGVAGGLLVEEASGPAAVAGIQAGDVLVSVDGTPIKTAEQLRDIVAKQKSNVALLIQRGDSRIFVPVELG